MGLLDAQMYMQLQAMETIQNASQGGGGAGMGVGLGAGMGAGVGMGQMMATMFSGMQPPQGAPPPQQAAAPSPAAGPPPLPQAPKFYVALGGQQAGPFDLATLQQHVQAGQLTKETLVWKEGMANWTAAGQVPDLANLFGGAAPPPLPPTD
jgi:membrane protease subunit (stomatin/prohibitin family)